MKIQISGLRGRYPVNFDRNRFHLPKDIYSVLGISGAKGFQASLCSEHEYKYLEMLPDSDGELSISKDRKVRISQNLLNELGIEEEGYLLGMDDRLELWGPSWKDYEKERKKDFQDSDMLRIL